jgi:hypothetical protein
MDFQCPPSSVGVPSAPCAVISTLSRTCQPVSPSCVVDVVDVVGRKQTTLNPAAARYVRPFAGCAALQPSSSKGARLLAEQPAQQPACRVGICKRKEKMFALGSKSFLSS